MTNQDLLEYVNKNVKIKLKNGKTIKGLFEQWFEYHNGKRYYSFNIRNVKHNIHYWDILSIKEIKEF